MFLLFGKAGFSAINKAWIKLSFGGNTSFYVLFVVEYQFCVGTAFSLDTWKFSSYMNMSSIMFFITDQPAIM